MPNCVLSCIEIEKGRVKADNEQSDNVKSDILSYLNESNRITVGLATCGRSAGAEQTYNKLKEAEIDIPVDVVGCSGMCFNEPIVTVRQDGLFSIYSMLTEEKVPSLIEAIYKNSRHEEYFTAERLEDLDFFKKQKRILMRRCGHTSPLDIKQFVSTGGFEGLEKALQMKPVDVIKTLEAASLRGRGGAGFSTAMKWKFLAEKENDSKFLIVNADEGDPGAFMNRTIIESDPFQIMEGLIIGAYATGARYGVIYTRVEYPLAVETFNQAINILREHGMLGENILGFEGFNFDVEVMKGAGAFVCGEETALMKSIEGERGHPRPRPPYPADKGVWTNPSNINNVETYAHVGNIFSMGVEEYQKIGSENNNGTKCVCLTGKIKKAGVAEVELGIPLRELIYEIGGGIKDDKKIKAVQSGGPSGGCIIEQELDTPMDYDHIPKLGAIMGSGGLVVMDEQDCMVSTARFFLNFTTGESCGKCVPCREGTKRMYEMIDSISKGVATEDVLERLNNLARVIKDTSLCGLGQSAPNPILSTIEKFRNEYEMHIRDKKCCCGVCDALIKYEITDECVGCGNCERHCPVDAISGQLKGKFVIDQEKCIKCGKCFEVCAFKAITKT